VILTAIPSEYAAVRSLIGDPTPCVHPAGTRYEIGVLESATGSWRVVLAQTGVGNLRAAVEAERAITTFEPRALIFVGVAGGIKDVEVGDVVVANKVYQYERGKSGSSFLPRPDVGEPSYEILQTAQSIIQSNQWPPTPPGGRKTRSPKGILGPIAAGEKIVASTTSDIAHLIRSTYSDAIAVEMEGAGVAAALRANRRVAWCVIRGISDLIDGKADSDAAGSQEMAAENAAAFAATLLRAIQRREPAVDQSASGSFRVDPRGDLDKTWWRALSTAMVDLYPQGPQHDEIWARAGGNPAHLELGGTGTASWFRALRRLRMGGGGSHISLTSLLRAVVDEYPNHAGVRELTEGALQ
jgi:nucleoside phosphorylase